MKFKIGDLIRHNSSYRPLFGIIVDVTQKLKEEWFKQPEDHYSVLFLDVNKIEAYPVKALEVSYILVDENSPCAIDGFW